MQDQALYRTPYINHRRVSVAFPDIRICGRREQDGREDATQAHTQVAARVGLERGHSMWGA